MSTDDSSKNTPQEVGRYSARSEYPGLWLPLHIFLIFTPFMAGFVIAGVHDGVYDLAFFVGIGVSYLLAGPLFDKSLEWTAFLTMLLFPKRGEKDGS